MCDLCLPYRWENDFGREIFFVRRKFFRRDEIFSSRGGILSLWCVIRVPNGCGDLILVVGIISPRNKFFVRKVFHHDLRFVGALWMVTLI